MRISKIYCKNYKQFKEAEVNDLQGVNYFIGRNGAGKSNIIGILEVFKQIFTGEWKPIENDFYANDINAELKLDVEITVNKDELKKIFPNNHDVIDQIKIAKLNYILVYNENTLYHESLKLHIDDYVGHVFYETRLNQNRYQFNMDNKRILTKRKRVTITNLKLRNEIRPLNQILNQTEKILQEYLHTIFSYKHMSNARHIEHKVELESEREISLNGKNLTKYLHTMFLGDDNRIIKYNDTVSKLSNKEIIKIKYIPEGRTLILNIMENGVMDNLEYTKLGSGHQHILFFALLSVIKSGIVYIEEPELHQHADLQKRIHKLIKKTSSENKIQYFIESHSPIFTGFQENESTYLVSKAQDVEPITKISKENSKIIRTELGISYSDILDQDNILFVEGESEEIAIQAFAKKFGYNIDNLKCWNLFGNSNAKHLITIKSYLTKNNRKMFLILDYSEDKKIMLEQLAKHGINENLCHIWKKDFEDAFDTRTIYLTAKDLCEKYEKEINFNTTEIEQKRKTKKTVAIFDELLGMKYPKVEGAELLVKHSNDNEEEFNRTIKEILETKFNISRNEVEKLPQK